MSPSALVGLINVVLDDNEAVCNDLGFSTQTNKLKQTV